MSRRRVVVTGLGAVSALGLSFEESWKAMLEGRNGIGPIEHFDTTEFTTKIAGSVMGYVPDEHFPPMVAKKLDLFTQFALLALAAAALAVSLADQINIAEWRLGRTAPGDAALSFINLDASAPPEVLQELESLDGVVCVRQVRL